MDDTLKRFEDTLWDLDTDAVKIECSFQPRSTNRHFYLIVENGPQAGTYSGPSLEAVRVQLEAMMATGGVR